MRIHQAGIPVDGLQRCSLCNEELIDNRNVMVPTGTGSPRFFEPDMLIEVSQGMKAVADPGAVVTCKIA